MKLSIKDRLTLIGLLPQEGTLTEMVEIYDLVRELKLSDEEREEVNYVEDGPAIKWSSEKDQHKDITLSNSQKDIIMKSVDALSSQGKVNLGQIETILKIKNG